MDNPERDNITHAQNTELRQIKTPQHRKIKRLTTRTSQNTRVNQCAREGTRSVIHKVEFGKSLIANRRNTKTDVKGKRYLPICEIDIS
jgi:hypothetical protein